MTGTLQSINLDYSDSKPIITLKLDSRAELESIEGLKDKKLDIEIEKHKEKRRTYSKFGCLGNDERTIRKVKYTSN